MLGSSRSCTASLAQEAPLTGSSATPEPVNPRTAVVSDLLQRRPLLASLVLVAGLATAVLTVCTPRYLTNDDAVMNMIASGAGLTDGPDEHLIYANILIGWALKALYQAAPGVPWYGGYLIATACISLIAVVYVFLRANPTCLQLLGVALFLAAFALPVLLRPQFTMVAFATGMAGLLLIIAAGAGIMGWGAFIAGPVFLLMSWLVRYESCILSCMMFAPALAVVFLYPAQARLRWLVALAVAAGLGGAGSAHALNQAHYAATPGWEHFYEFNRLQCRLIVALNEQGSQPQRPERRPERQRRQAGKRGQRGQRNERGQRAQQRQQPAARDGNSSGQKASSSQSGPSVQGSVPNAPLARGLKAAGWSLTDLALFCSWSFADPQRFDVDSYKTILQHIDEGGARVRSWEVLLRTLAGDRRLTILLVTGVVCLLVAGGSWLRRAIPLVTLPIAAGLSAFLYFNHYLPERVYLSAFTAFPATALALAAGPRRWGDLGAIRRGAVLTGTVAVALLVVSETSYLSRDSARRPSRAEVEGMLAELAPRPEHLYVFWGADFPYEDTVYPAVAQALPAQLKAVTFSWATRTPLMEQRLEQFGITDIYRAAYEHGNVRFICRPENAALLCVYLKEHYGVEARPEEVFSHPVLRTGRVFRIRPVGSAGAGD